MIIRNNANKIITWFLTVVLIIFLTACSDQAAQQEESSRQESSYISEPIEKEFGNECYFDIYNESDFDIASIIIEPMEGSFDGVELLSTVLVAGESVEIQETISGDMASIQDWSLYITDTNGHKSVQYDEFRLFEVGYIDINWNANLIGYYCEFYYGDTQSDPAAINEFSFAVMNDFNYDITAIYMVPAGGAVEDGVDVLPSTLEPGKWATISSDSIPESMASVTDWTIYFIDLNGDTSRSYEDFDPFTVESIRVTWAPAGGYRGLFNYDIEHVELSLQTGKWFENGVPNGDGNVVEVFEDGTVSIADSSGQEWHKDTLSLSNNDGVIRMNMDFSGDAVPVEGIVSSDLKSFCLHTSDFLGGMDLLYLRSVYIHESTVDSPEAHDIIQRAKLRGYFWTIEGEGDIIFAYDGNISSKGSQERYGKWEYEGGVLTIKWEDETESECQVENVEEGFTIPSIGRITGSNSYDTSEEW